VASPELSPLQDAGGAALVWSAWASGVRDNVGTVRSVLGDPN
jgi:hypothetical protein